MRYDAQNTKKGFIEVWQSARNGTKPRFWQVTATPITTDGQQLDRTHIKFKISNRVKLSELAPVINEHILLIRWFLDKCVSVIVCAGVMTEGACDGNKTFYNPAAIKKAWHAKKQCKYANIVYNDEKVD